MASRADQVAANLSLAKFGEATELRKRIWFTLGALIIFRLLSFDSSDTSGRNSLATRRRVGKMIGNWQISI